MNMQDKLKKDQYYYMIKSILEKLDKEGIDALYQSFKNAKPTNGTSIYSALFNDIVANCPDSKEWKNLRSHDRFERDIRYYCDYYLSFYDDEN